jgi:hypothetical protein
MWKTSADAAAGWPLHCTHNSLVSECHISREWQMSEEVFKQAQAAGVSPTSSQLLHQARTTGRAMAEGDNADAGGWGDARYHCVQLAHASALRVMPLMNADSLMTSACTARQGLRRLQQRPHWAIRARTGPSAHARQPPARPCPRPHSATTAAAARRQRPIAARSCSARPPRAPPASAADLAWCIARCGTVSRTNRLVGCLLAKRANG